MRVLIVSQWYTPEPNVKSHDLARGLRQRGHEVQVLTAFPSYPHGKTYPGYRQRPGHREEIDGIPVHRVPTFPDHSGSAIRRALSYASYAVSASIAAVVKQFKPDVVWAYHPPLTVAYPAFVAARLAKAPLVFEVQDVWPEAIGATGMAPSALLLRSVGVMADRVYQAASAVTVISPGFKRNLIAKGVPAGKIHVIPNWAMGSTEPASAATEGGDAHGLAGKFNVIYAGNVGPAQDLMTVLGAAELLREVRDVRFVIVGDGLERDVLRSAAAERGLANVQFVDRQPGSEMHRIYAHAGALLAHLRHNPLFEITIPSKIIAYLAAGRPIIGAVEGDAADVVRKAGAGLTCASGNPQELADAVLRLFKMSAEERDAMGRAGRQAFESGFTVDALIPLYEDLFQRLLKSQQPGS